MATLIAIFIGLIFIYSLVSKWLEKTVLTAPIVFTAVGMLVLTCVPELHKHQPSIGALLQVAEIGLVLLLFTDASKTDLQVLKHIRSLPMRLLSTGMLLTIVLGALGAKLVFPDLSIWQCGILSAILAPTDAGLGQIIVNSPRVPMKIRQALNVEAGLNDGLSVPFLLFFIALSGGEPHGERLTQFMVEQLGYGALIGLGVGWIGGCLLGLARHKELMTETFEHLGLVALPLFCALGCEPVGASMFIAAFVAGLAVQVGFKEAGEHSIAFTEDWGQFLNLSVFFLFGLLIAKSWQSFTLAHWIYAILSLTVVRLLPVAIALIGTRLSRATVLFMGWFGPRGLASIVLGLVWLEHGMSKPGASTIHDAVMVTVLLSIFAHGLSALPGIKLYETRIAGLDAGAPEHQAVGQAHAEQPMKLAMPT